MIAKFPLFLPLMGIVIAVSGCTTNALPGRVPGEIMGFAEQAEASASRAEEHAKTAQEERKRSEELLREARELLQRAQQAEQSCAALVAKIPKPRVIYRKAPEPKVTAKEGEAKSSDSADKPSDKVPLYSPSDAPIGKQAPVAK